MSGWDQLMQLLRHPQGREAFILVMVLAFLAMVLLLRLDWSWMD